MSKTCSACGVEGGEEIFYRNRKGLHSTCKTCYKSRHADYNKKYRRDNPIPIRCRKLRHRAREKGLPFNLTPEYLESIWTGVCPVFNMKLEFNVPKNSETSCEVDRIVPELGYVEGNVVWLSHRANRIKDDATLEELERIVGWLKSQQS